MRRRRTHPVAWVPWLDLALAPVVLLVLAAASGTGLGSWPVLAALLVTWPALLTVHGAYRRPALQQPGTALWALLPALGSLALLLWTGTLVGLLDPLSPSLRTGVLTVVATTVAVHTAATVRVRRPRLVVIGDPDHLAAARPRLENAAAHRWDLAGLCLTRPGTGPAPGIAHDVARVVGLEHLGDLAADHDADVALLLHGHDLDPSTLRRAAWALERVGTELVVGTLLVDVAPRRTACTEVGGWSAVHVHHVARRGPAALLRVVLDHLLAALALAALLPLLVLVALAVRADSPGPALYRQVRIGRDGRPFTMWKFRTMQTGADARLSDLADDNEAVDGPLFKIRQDPRVTRVGRVLRRYSLDELPQLVNVLGGHMSLVGPRPALPHEVAAYDEDARRRLHVRPGLTGLWQVSGRSDLSWEESVRLDVSYVDNWSLTLDAAILGRTVGAVLRHRGAY